MGIPWGYSTGAGAVLVRVSRARYSVYPNRRAPCPGASNLNYLGCPLASACGRGPQAAGSDPYLLIPSRRSHTVLAFLSKNGLGLPSLAYAHGAFPGWVGGLCR